LDVVEYLALSYPGAESARTPSGDLPVLLSGKSSSLDVIYALLKRKPEVVPSWLLSYWSLVVDGHHCFPWARSTECGGVL